MVLVGVAATFCSFSLARGVRNSEFSWPDPILAQGHYRETTVHRCRKLFRPRASANNHVW